MASFLLLPMNRLSIILTISLFAFSFHAEAQLYSRFQADFSIKEIGYDGKQNLITGTIYYNKTNRTVYYDFQFPEASSMVIMDTCTVRPDSKKIISHNMGVSMIDFSIYNLFLNQNLDMYGLNETSYQLTDMEESDEMVISTWELPGKQVVDIGKMLLSQKNGQLFGLISMDKEDSIISKQFFMDYENIENLPFPTRVIQFSYMGDRESKKITTYRNIILNSKENEDFYNYTIDFEPSHSGPAMVPVGGND